MRAQPLPLIGGFYADETRPWSLQDICNWLPVATESDGTRTPTMAKTPPGLSPFVDTGEQDPVRVVYSAEDRLFTVAGNTAYQISNSGVAIPLGSVSGVGRVRCAHNQITGGNEVLFVNGSAGWVWNTAAGTWAQITDEGYPGAINAVFIDGYLIQIEPARRFAFHSDLADALSYNTLDRFTSEVSPDLLVSLAVSNNELLLFSERTTEFFENTGAAQQPFRSKRISFQKGCAGRYTVATMDNTVFWLGDDGVFYLLDGYSPRRISTRPIEQAIRGKNWAQAFAFVWEDSGHSVCYWTFPDGLTFGYDASQQKWHRRASYGFNRWRVQDLTYWHDRWIAGDFQNGRLWELDWAYPFEGDQEFVSEITSPVIHDNQSRVLMPRLELVMDTGMPEVSARAFDAQPDGPSISGAAPDGTLAQSYGPFAYTVTAGDAAIVSVEVRSGALPDGLTLSSAGVIEAGTPSAQGSFSFTIRATDSNGLWAELTDSVVIGPALFLAGISGVLSGSASALNTDISPGITLGNTPLIKWLADRLFCFASGGNRVRVNGAWQAITGVPTSNVRDIVETSAGLIVLVGGDRYVYRSTDDGLTFSQVDCAGVGNTMNAFCIMQVGDTLEIDYANPSIQSRKSTDGGLTWANGAFRSGASNWNPVPAAATFGNTVVAVGAFSTLNRVRVSADGMATWSTVTTSATSVGWAYAAHNGTRWLILDNGGVTATSTAGGSGWSAGPTLSGGVSGQFRHNRLAPYNGSFVMAESQAGGIGTVAAISNGVAAWATIPSTSITVQGGTSVTATDWESP